MKISPEKMAQYQKLGQTGMFDNKDPEIHAFFQRLMEEEAPAFEDFFSGELNFFAAPRSTDLTGVDIALVGVPMDAGAPLRPGARLAPRAVREWTKNFGPVHDLWHTIPFELCNIVDYGDVYLSNPNSVEVAVADIQTQYEAFRKAGVNTLSIGGIHTIAHPMVAGLTGNGEEALGLVHIDAHCDTLGAWQGEELSDGSVFRNAVLCGAIDPERTIQIGIRGRGTVMWDFSHDVGMRVVTMDELEEKGVPYVIDMAREIVGDKPTYLSVDIDGFDSSYAPGTQMPEPFGLTSREGRQILRGMRGVDFIGADIVEIAPPYDCEDMTAILGAALMFEMLCLLSEARVARTGKKNKTHWK